MERADRPARRRIPALPLIVLTFLAALCVAGSVALISDRGADFQMFYQSALLWSKGLSPYGGNPNYPNLTPPAMLPLFRLFALMPFELAQLVWTVLSLWCLALCLPFIERYSGMRRFDVAVLVLGSAPGMIALAIGQVGYLLMLVMTAAWHAARQQRPVVTGSCIGFLCLVKPFYGLFVLWMVWRREWRGVAAAMAVFAAGVLLGVALVGVGGTLDWVERVRAAQWYTRVYNAGIVGVGARLFAPHLDPLPGTKWTPLIVSPILQWTTTIALSAAAIVAGTIALKRRAADIDLAFAVLGLSGLLLSPLAWVHYLPVSAGPVLAVLARRPRWSYWLLGLIAILPYPFINNQPFGRVGTVLGGMWACGLVLILFALTVSPTMAPHISSTAQK